MSKSELDNLRSDLWNNVPLKTALRNVVSSSQTGYSYDELVAFVKDPHNEDPLDIDEVENVDKTVNLLSHLFHYFAKNYPEEGCDE